MSSSEGSSVESETPVEVSPIRLVIADELGTLRSKHRLRRPAENLVSAAVDWVRQSDLTTTGTAQRHGEPCGERGVTCLTTLLRGDRTWLCTGRKDGSIEVLTSDSLRPVASQPPSDGSRPVCLTAFSQPSQHRRPGLLSVYKDGRLCLYRFRKDFWQLEELEDRPSPSRIKTVLSLKVAEDITTADLCQERCQVAFGGEEVHLSLCDLQTKQLTFVSKPPRNPYQLTKRLWVTACCFVPQSHGQLLFGGNAEHELFLYDVRARKRPMFVMESWRDARVTQICPEPNGSQLWVANAKGFVDRFDLRKMSIRGSLTGQVTGSIRNLKLFEFASQSLIASVGLDRFLRVYSTEHRQLRQKLYCKYPLTAVEVLPFIPPDPSSEESGAEEAVSKRQRLRE